MIAGQFRLNQGETREFFYKTVRQTVNNFVSAALAEDEERGIAEAEVGATEDDGAAGNSGNRKGRDAGASRAQAELSHQLEVLRALAATGPGNIRAAEGVAASVASALIRAAGERTMDLMQLHQIAVDRRYVISRCAPTAYFPMMVNVAVCMSYSQSTPYINNRQQQALKEELIATQKENAELRASLAQLRKSNVQVARACHPPVFCSRTNIYYCFLPFPYVVAHEGSGDNDVTQRPRKDRCWRRCKCCQRRWWGA